MSNVLEKSKDNMIINLIQDIDEFAIVIYENENNEGYKLLVNIIDKLDLIISLKSTIVLEKEFKIYIYELTNRIPELLEAFENNDNVLVSDILKYEIKPVLENLIKIYKKMS